MFCRNLLAPQYTESFVEDGKIIYRKVGSHTGTISTNHVLFAYGCKGVCRYVCLLLQGQKNCFYHGTVVGYADWTVAMSTCAGLR